MSEEETCPFRFFYGYDLGQCPDVGDQVCRRQPEEVPFDEYGQTKTEYATCNISGGEFVNCGHYRKAKGLTEKV